MDIEKLNGSLRDSLATLKWQIWESQGVCKRDDLPDREQFVSKVIDEAEGKYTLEMIENERFHDKNAVDEDEVYSFYSRLHLSGSNAFLLRTNHDAYGQIAGSNCSEGI